MFLVDIQVQILCDGLQQLFPIDVTGPDRQSRAREDSDILFFQLFDECFYEMFSVLVHALFTGSRGFLLPIDQGTSAAPV